MSKTIVIKLTKSGPTAGPFTITDDLGNTLATGVTKKALIDGVSYSVDNSVATISVESTGKCKLKRSFAVGTTNPIALSQMSYKVETTGCLWRHLTNVENYNYFYGNIEPYIIEYPFAYKYQDEILQSVQDYTKAYKYWANDDGVFNDNDRIELDDQWFNKAILYNGQQCSGVLNLVPKPINNLKEYMKYPLYSTDSKTITYTKSDNFYQYNTFWSLVKDKSIPIFLSSCKSLSIDKVINQPNMDYGKRSFKKEPLRAKELRIRHILDDSSRVHLVSQFIIAKSQISFK